MVLAHSDLTSVSSFPEIHLIHILVSVFEFIDNVILLLRSKIIQRMVFFEKRLYLFLPFIFNPSTSASCVNLDVWHLSSVHRANTAKFPQIYSDAVFQLMLLLLIWHPCDLLAAPILKTFNRLFTYESDSPYWKSSLKCCAQLLYAFSVDGDTFSYFLELLCAWR